MIINVFPGALARGGGVRLFTILKHHTVSSQIEDATNGKQDEKITFSCHVAICTCRMMLKVVSKVCLDLKKHFSFA